MTTTQHYTLSGMYQHLYRQAARTGRDQRTDLRKGARIAVRVRDGHVALTVARKAKPVGDGELVVFQRVCQVPRHAQRQPETGQATREHDGEVWHTVTWTWWEEQDDAL